MSEMLVVFAYAQVLTPSAVLKPNAVSICSEIVARMEREGLVYWRIRAILLKSITERGIWESAHDGHMRPHALNLQALALNDSEEICIWMYPLLPFCRVGPRRLSWSVLSIENASSCISFLSYSLIILSVSSQKGISLWPSQSWISAVTGSHTTQYIGWLISKACGTFFNLVNTNMVPVVLFNLFLMGISWVQLDKPQLLQVWPVLILRDRNSHKRLCRVNVLGASCVSVGRVWMASQLFADSTKVGFQMLFPKRQDSQNVCYVSEHVYSVLGYDCNPPLPRISLIRVSHTPYFFFVTDLLLGLWRSNSLDQAIMRSTRVWFIRPIDYCRLTSCRTTYIWPGGVSVSSDMCTWAIWASLECWG